jgi:hypothetical protein
VVAKVQRVSVSRQKRNAEEKTRQATLRRFVDSLDSIIRRSILDKRSMTLEDWRCMVDRQDERLAAVRQYEALAIHVPSEWRRYSRIAPDRAMLAELRLLGHRKKPGAPRVRRDATEHQQVLQLVKEAEIRLAQWWSWPQERPNISGFASGEERLSAALSALGYARDERLAIQKKRTLHTAAMFLVSRQTGKALATIKSSLARTRT